MNKLYEAGTYKVFERKNKASESLEYSFYMLCNGDRMVFEFRVPNPVISSSKKTMFLTYQTSVKTFLKDLIDVLKGEKDSIRTICPKQKKSLMEIEHQIGRIYIVQDDVALAEIFMKDSEKAERFAESFIQYFCGPVDDIDWESIL